jgi:hypothetical protein
MHVPRNVVIDSYRFSLTASTNRRCLGAQEKVLARHCLRLAFQPVVALIEVVE